MTKQEVKAQWKSHELPKLKATYGIDSDGEAKKFQVQSAEAILSAVGRWLLKLLQATKVHHDANGIEVHIKVGQDKINILQPVSDTRMMDIVWLALQHSAPLHPDASSWDDIKDDNKKKQEALAKMTELLSSFNDQMRKATGDCMQIPWQMATAQFPDILEPNVLAGIAVWALMAGGHGSSQARIDDLKDRAVKSTGLEVIHAKDVAGYLGNVNQHVLQLVQESVPIAQASEIVLRPVLETLKGGILVEVSKPDAHAWKLIGAKAEELNMKRLRKETLDWTSVYGQIMQVYSQSFTGSNGCMSTRVNGPASKTVKMPLNMALAAINGDNEIDEDEVGAEMALAAQSYAKPATVEDYHKAMQGQALPTVKIIRKQTQLKSDGPTGRADSRASGANGKRPFMKKWTCAQIIDGKKCNTSNFYYATADQYDTTINNKCAGCGKPKQVARTNDVAKALAAMQAKLDAQTEQMAKLQQAAEAKAPAVAQAAVDFAGMSASGNDFGCIALEGGVVPNFDDMTVRGGDDMAFYAQASLGNDLVMKGAHKDEKVVTDGTHSFVNLAPTKIAMEPLGGINSSDTPNIAMEQRMRGPTRPKQYSTIVINLLNVSVIATIVYAFMVALATLCSDACQATWRAMKSGVVSAQFMRMGHATAERISYFTHSHKQAITWMMFFLLVYVTCTSYDGHGVSNGRKTWTAISAIIGVNSTQHKQYCLYAAAHKEPALFLDSCCSTTIISDASLLCNIRTLQAPRMINGLTGEKAINQVGDLRMVMTNQRGQKHIETIPNVYYDPHLPYNLVSMGDVTDAKYTVMFSHDGNYMRGPGGTFEINKTSSKVYTLPAETASMAHVAMGMTTEEYMHLKFSHAISYRKMAKMSRDGVPGIPKGLKEKDIKCAVCTHANITKNNAPGVATGASDADCHFDMVDMSRIKTISGMQYCTVFIMTKTRYAYCYLHKTKDEITAIMDRFLEQFDADTKPRVMRSDCAEEYGTPAMQAILHKHGVHTHQHSNEYQQFQNGKAEKFIDTLGRRIRAMLLNSQLPPEFWGAAVMLATDIYNVTPHDSLNDESPFKRAKGQHPDTSFIKPFGCGMIVHRGRDLVEHSKLAPRGEKCVYLGTGNAFGRKAYIAYSPRLNRVFSTVDAQFDECYFPFRLVDQREHGHIAPQPKLEQLSLFHDIPNPTIEQLIERINSTQVPGNDNDMRWLLSDLTKTPNTLSSGERTDLTGGDRTGLQGQHDTDDTATDPYGLRIGGENAAKMTPATLRDLQRTVFAHGPPGQYGEALTHDAWKRYCCVPVKDLTNTELAEGLIGMEARITCPESYWPQDKVSWHVQIMEHQSDGRVRGGHKFHAALINSTPQYKYKVGEPQQYDAMLSAWHVRNAIEINHGGTHKTLNQIFGDQNTTSMAHAAVDVAAGIARLVTRATGRETIRIAESNDTAASAVEAMACAAMICDDYGTEYVGLRPEPRHYHDIAKRPDADRWYAACDAEIKKLFDMGAFDIVDTPPDKKVMEGVFSFKTKYDSEGNVLKYAARGNVNGSKQEPGTFGDTFAPTGKFSCIRSICALAAQEGMTLYQFDIKGAFLLAPCKEDIYLNFPGRYKLPKGKCLKCRSYVYGLKQSAARWHELFSGWLSQHGFENLDTDGVTFIKQQTNADKSVSKIMLSIHVDDGLAASNDDEMYQQFLHELKADFELSDCGELQWLLGCKVEQDRVNGTVRLTQQKYCEDVLRRFQMHNSTPVATPCEVNMHLTDEDCPPQDQRDPEVVRAYQQCVGACMYLTCFTRGDCSFAVNQCARFMNNPGPSHIAAIKRVLRYLAGTKTRGITYKRNAGDSSADRMGFAVQANQLTACADADHAGAKDRRSVSGYALMLNGAMVMWTSKRQPVTAVSSTESEFYSVSQCALDCVYLRRILDLMGYKQVVPTLIAQDNNACIYLVKGAGMYQRAKHIDTRIYRVRELSASGDVSLYKVPGEYQPADLFTKGLPRVAFERHRRYLMGE